MPSNKKVNTLHPMLVEKADQIRRSRDCYRGTDAVKAGESAGVTGIDELYLPKLSGQDQSEYRTYKLRALFYAAMARTVTALVGAIDRKPPEVKGADHLEDFNKDVTGTGVSLTEFLKELETEIMISGRVIVCIDRMNSENNRPYLVWYKNEDCINWFTEEYSEFDKQLGAVVFREMFYKPCEDNPYEQIACNRYREFVKDPQGNVTVNIWTPETVNADGLGSENTNYVITETYSVHNRGKALGFLPVVPIVSEGSPLEIPKPPLIDLVDVNLSHYRNSADYEHGLHWTALPTPWFSGLNDRGTQISLGSGAAIALPDPSSKAGFLEFSGVGLKAILDSMKHKEQLMSSLGARMLAGGMDQSTSAEVAKINVSGEIAALRNVAKSMSRGITRLLRMVSHWEGKSIDDISIHLNEDYIDATLPAADVTALVSAYQAGAMSLDSLLWNLDQGERLPMSRTVEEEMSLIEGDMDKEASFALGFEESGIAFTGNSFSSESSSNEIPAESEEDGGDE